jgi:hypothetical protein
MSDRKPRLLLASGRPIILFYDVIMARVYKRFSLNVSVHNVLRCTKNFNSLLVRKHLFETR